MQKSFGICALPFTISISLDAENMAKEGYQSMPQDLIRFLKDGRKCWVKQGELSILSPIHYRVPKNVSAFEQQ